MVRRFAGTPSFRDRDGSACGLALFGDEAVDYGDRKIGGRQQGRESGVPSSQAGTSCPLRQQHLP